MINIVWKRGTELETCSNSSSKIQNKYTRTGKRKKEKTKMKKQTIMKIISVQIQKLSKKKVKLSELKTLQPTLWILTLMSSFFEMAKRVRIHNGQFCQIISSSLLIKTKEENMIVTIYKIVYNSQCQDKCLKKITHCRQLCQSLLLYVHLWPIFTKGARIDKAQLWNRSSPTFSSFEIDQRWKHM